MTEEFMQYAQDLKNEKLLETEYLYQSDPVSYFPHFQKNISSICENIKTLQKSGLLGNISYLEYTLLHTNLMQKKYIAEVRVYHDKWYFDARQYIAGYFDFSSLFVRYHELWEQLSASRKRFPGVSAQEITAFILSCARHFYRYVISACRFLIPSCTDTEPFLSLQRTDAFEIRVGEYMARTEPVYTENRKRTAEEALEWLSKRLEYDYYYESFTGLDLSHADLSKTSLDYTDFRNAILTGTNFRNARLTGSRFCQSDLTDADFRNCVLHEADFHGAQLSGASFVSATSFYGIIMTPGWTNPGYRCISFRNADLSHADLRNAYIPGADFTGAVMNGTLLLQDQLSLFLLSPQQRQAVCITDAQP